MNSCRENRLLTCVVTEHVALTHLYALPIDAIHAARRSLLDGLGVMLAATELSPATHPYREYACALGAGPCTILGGRRGATAVAAATANGALAHALDFGDTFDAGPATRTRLCFRRCWPSRSWIRP